MGSSVSSKDPVSEDILILAIKVEGIVIFINQGSLLFSNHKTVK